MGRLAKICRKADNPQADWMVFDDQVSDLVGRFQEGQELPGVRERRTEATLPSWSQWRGADPVTGRAPTRGALPREYFP